MIVGRRLLHLLTEARQWRVQECESDDESEGLRDHGRWNGQVMEELLVGR